MSTPCLDAETVITVVCRGKNYTAEWRYRGFEFSVWKYPDDWSGVIHKTGHRVRRGAILSFAKHPEVLAALARLTKADFAAARKRARQDAKASAAAQRDRDIAELRERAAALGLAVVDPSTGAILTPAELSALSVVLRVADAVFYMMDNAGWSDDGADDMTLTASKDDADEVTLTVFKDDSDRLNETLSSLNELPDDQPGFTMSRNAKARWALRRLLPKTETEN